MWRKEKKKVKKELINKCPSHGFIFFLFPFLWDGHLVKHLSSATNQKERRKETKGWWLNLLSLSSFLSFLTFRSIRKTRKKDKRKTNAPEIERKKERKRGWWLLILFVHDHLWPSFTWSWTLERESSLIQPPTDKALSPTFRSDHVN